MVPDSASTATALFTGVKVNQETIGVDASVNKENCTRSLLPEVRLKSLAVLAHEAGKSSGKNLCTSTQFEIILVKSKTVIDLDPRLSPVMRYRFDKE